MKHNLSERQMPQHLSLGDSRHLPKSIDTHVLAQEFPPTVATRPVFGLLAWAAIDKREWVSLRTG